MFDIPEAKRVRREDLYESSHDGEESQDELIEGALRDKLHDQLSGLLGLDLVAPPSASPQPRVFKEDQAGDRPSAPQDEANAEPEAETFQFRLFGDEPVTHTVVLERNDDGAGNSGRDGGFVVAKRPTSYYVAEDPDSDALARFRFAAVTAEYVMDDACRRRWGLEKPWRVTAIPVSWHKVPGFETPEAPAPDSKRKRPGKKRRILLRVTEKTKKEKEEAQKKSLLDKEEHLKEKKKRLNRQRQLKRRAKEREKKQSGQANETAEDADDADTGSGSE